MRSEQPKNDDVMLPGKSGIELAQWVRHRHPGCKLLLISGHPAVEQMLQWSAEGGQVFPILAKPVSPDHILQFLRA